MQIHFRSHELSQSIDALVIYIKSHPFIEFFFIGLLAIVAVQISVRFLTVKKNPNDDTFTHKDFERIAGEDVFSTQVDLARAYIEMSQTKLAKQVLKQVIKQANGKSKRDAKQLMKML